jgi:hypothetical protein
MQLALIAANGQKAPVWKSTNFDAGLYDIKTLSQTRIFFNTT